MLNAFLSDNHLVAKVIKGHANAFEELVNRYQKRLYRFCWHILQNRENAEDAVQQTFLKFWQKPYYFNPEKQTLFSTWLYQIAKNNCTDLMRKNHPYFLGEKNDATEEIANNHFDAETNHPDQTYEQQEKLTILQQAINHLDEEQRTIVILYHLQGESYKEIAKIMNLSLKMVEGHLYRARKKMQLFL